MGDPTPDENEPQLQHHSIQNQKPPQGRRTGRSHRNTRTAFKINHRRKTAPKTRTAQNPKPPRGRESPAGCSESIAQRSSVRMAARGRIGRGGSPPSTQVAQARAGRSDRPCCSWREQPHQLAAVDGVVLEVPEALSRESGPERPAGLKLEGATTPACSSQRRRTGGPRTLSGERAGRSDRPG